MIYCVECKIRGKQVGRYCSKCCSRKQYPVRKRRQFRIKEELFNKLGGQCVNCGNKDIRVIEFHHINPNIKSKKIVKKDGHYQAVLTRIQIYNKEINNLQLLCANCHRIHNYETIWKNKYNIEYTNNDTKNILNKTNIQWTNFYKAK